MSSIIRHIVNSQNILKSVLLSHSSFLFHFISKHTFLIIYVTANKALGKSLKLV